MQGPSETGRLRPLLGRYDALQMMKHAVAIYSEYRCICDGGGEVPARTVLLNCVWEMRDPGELGGYEGRYRGLLEQERGQFSRFLCIVQPELSELFARVGTSFDLCYCSFAEMVVMLGFAPERAAYLERFIV